MKNILFITYQCKSAKRQDNFEVIKASDSAEISVNQNLSDLILK